MFNKISNNSKVSSFIESLSYWEYINLSISLLQSSQGLSFRDAKVQATVNYKDKHFLEALLDEVLHCPNAYRKE